MHLLTGSVAVGGSHHLIMQRGFFYAEEFPVLSNSNGRGILPRPCHCFYGWNIKTLMEPMILQPELVYYETAWARTSDAWARMAPWCSSVSNSSRYCTATWGIFWLKVFQSR